MGQSPGIQEEVTSGVTLPPLAWVARHHCGQWSHLWADQAAHRQWTRLWADQAAHWQWTRRSSLQLPLAWQPYERHTCSTLKQYSSQYTHSLSEVLPTPQEA